MKIKYLRVGFVQADVSFASLKERQDCIQHAIKKLVQHRCTLILLPEIFLGTPLPTQQALFARQYRTFKTTLKRLAQAADIFLYGSYYQKTKAHKKAFNSAFLISKTHEKTYHKIHVFRPGQEHQNYLPGTRSKIFESPWGKIAPLICYDIRFPELLRKLTFQGARLALVCAQWPQSRLTHWLTLLKARAIENQIFICACNARGKKDHNIYNGHSCVISPWGEILFLLKNQLTGFCDIPLTQIDQVRENYPFLTDALKNKFHYDM